MTKIGILGVIFMYAGVAGTVSATAPWFVRGDTDQHVDYVWRVYKGDIPKWSDGIQYPIFNEMQGPKAQAASANPPLFYILHAPIVGPLLERGEWEKAIAVGRVINMFFGVLAILALAWAGWLFGGRRKELVAVATPALTALIFRFTRLNVDYALDALVVLFSTLVIINAYKIFLNGLKPKYLAALLILSVLGMSTKATYIVPFSLSLLAIPLSTFIRDKKWNGKSVLRNLLISAGVLVAVAAATGWFYYFWNYKTNGSWFNPFPDNFTGGRPVKSLMEVMTSGRLWKFLYGSYANIVAVSVAIISFALAGFLTMGASRFKTVLKNKALSGAVALMFLLAAGVLATQIVHAVGIGSINFRYMLPALLPIGLFLAYGLLEFKRVSGQLVTLAATAMGASTFYTYGFLTSLSKMQTALTKNSLPEKGAFLLIALFIIGVGLLAISMFALSKNTILHQRRPASRQS